jgi:rhomboid protease GluP
VAEQERHSILCPNCRKLISADETRCPYCGTVRPGSWWKNNPLSRGFLSADQFVGAIIAVNIGMYVLSLLIGSGASRFSFNPFAILSPGNTSLLLLGATGTLPIDRLHRWWTLISASYLHGSILHIFFNMIVFKQLAELVLREYGANRLFIIYTASGVAGFWVSYMVGIPLTLGASAAVCGLMGSLLYYGKNRGGVYGHAVYRQIGGWAVGIFLIGLLVPGINNWAHGGGLAAGAFLGFVLGYQERVRERGLHRILARTLAILTGMVLAWAVFSAFYYQLFG